LFDASDEEGRGCDDDVSQSVSLQLLIYFLRDTMVAVVVELRRKEELSDEEILLCFSCDSNEQQRNSLRKRWGLRSG
jgi:hypothetical protein